MFKKVIILTLVLFSPACSLMSREAPTEDVDKAAVLFFERVKSAQYDKIYNDSAKSFQERNAKAEVLDNLKKMADLGKSDTPIRANMYFGKEEEKRTATPTYAVRFDQTRASVILKFIDESGEWKLAGFEVRQKGS